MAKKTIGNLHARVTADGQQFRAEMEKCDQATRRFAGGARGSGETVTGTLEGMLKKGTLGKLAAGFGHLAAAAVTAWSAFETGQKFGEGLVRHLEHGAVSARRLLDELSALHGEGEGITGKPGELERQLAKVGDFQTTIIGLEQKLAKLNADIVSGAARVSYSTLKQKEQQVEQARQDLAVEEGKLKVLQQQQRIEQDKADAERRRQDAARAFEDWREKVEADAAAAQRKESEELDRQIELGVQVERDRLGLLRERAAAEQDQAKRLALQREAVEMESAQRIAEFRRQLDAETDAQARQFIEERIELERRRAAAALSALVPEAAAKASPTELKSPSALLRGTADERRAMFMASHEQARRADTAATRQIRLQEQMAKSLKSIDGSLRDTNTEIVLL